MLSVRNEQCIRSSQVHLAGEAGTVRSEADQLPFPSQARHGSHKFWQNNAAYVAMSRLCLPDSPGIQDHAQVQSEQHASWGAMMRSGGYSTCRQEADNLKENKTPNKQGCVGAPSLPA